MCTRQTNIRGVLSLMKANHPADCMNCDANGGCCMVGWLDGSGRMGSPPRQLRLLHHVRGHVGHLPATQATPQRLRAACRFTRKR